MDCSDAGPAAVTAELYGRLNGARQRLIRVRSHGAAGQEKPSMGSFRAGLPFPYCGPRVVEIRQVAAMKASAAAVMSLLILLAGAPAASGAEPGVADFYQG